MKSLLINMAVISAVISAALCAAPAAAHADDYAFTDPNIVHRGMSELDLGVVGVLEHESANGTAFTDASTSLSARYHYYLHDRFSVGGEAILGYEHDADTTTTTTYGGTLFATAHLRLGSAAFVRPTLGLGVLFGSSSLTTGTTFSIDSSSTAFLTRIQLPFAYFATDSIVLQAGPELDVQLGSSSPNGGGASTSFTKIVGGFSVAVGVAF